MSDFVNEVLGLKDKVDFSKLPSKELKKLYDFVSDPSNLIGVGLRAIRSSTAKAIEKSPLREMLDKPLRDLISEREEGIFGFGILPKVFRKRSKSKSES